MERTSMERIRTNIRTSMTGRTYRTNRIHRRTGGRAMTRKVSSNQEEQGAQGSESRKQEAGEQQYAKQGSG
jgi:hypothetical protein